MSRHLPAKEVTLFTADVIVLAKVKVTGVTRVDFCFHPGYPRAQILSCLAVFSLAFLATACIFLRWPQLNDDQAVQQCSHCMKTSSEIFFRFFLQLM